MLHAGDTANTNLHLGLGLLDDRVTLGRLGFCQRGNLVKSEEIMGKCYALTTTVAGRPSY